MKKSGWIFILSGPSGSGKTTLIERLVRLPAYTTVCVRSVSFTTRPPRANEQNGRDYFFISEPEFRTLRREKKILEWTRYLGYYYATSRDFVEQQLSLGHMVMLCLDYKGVQQIKRLFRDRVVTVFVVPPSIDELNRRIVSRCARTSCDEIRSRLAMAEKELEIAERYDYRIQNTDLDEAVKQLEKIVGVYLGK